MIATLARREESCSTIALMKCVVPIVTLATEEGEIEEEENMEVRQLLIPTEGLVVVEAL
jgi:hypothetical protein